MRWILLVTFYFLISSSKAQTDSLSSTFPTDSNYLTSFDGSKIYYEVRGKGKPILLIHGFIANSTSWKKGALYPDLLKAGYKVIILDMRGNGRSDKPHDSTAYDNDAEAKDIMLLMDHLQIANYSAVGYSRGSIITARLLVLDKRVSTAVMGGMGTDFTNPEWPRRIMFYHAMMGDSIPELKGAVDYVKQQHLDQLALAYLQRSQPSTSKKTLANIKQKILVISGDKDSDNGSAADLARLLPNADIATVPGDHGNASSTPEFSKEIISFLKRNNY